MKENSPIEAVIDHFHTLFKGSNTGYKYLDRHVQEVERWALKLLDKYPNADRETVLLGVWLHDIGQLIGDKDIDHAVKSEQEAIRILSKLNINQNLIDKIAHCVRSHRNSDVQPDSLEAKIVAAADSASHLTDINYIVHLTDGMKEYVKGKLERDFRDVSVFPELESELEPLYKAWIELIRVFPEYLK